VSTTISLSQLTAKRSACAGCRDNFYNGGGNSTTGHCWSLPEAKMVWRWRIGMQTPMDRRDRFTRVKVHNCFHGEGPYRDIFLKRLPSHLGGDWADKAEQREAEANA